MKTNLILGFLIVMAMTVSAASCSGIDIKASDVSLEESSTEYFFFDIENNSNQDFEIQDVTVGDSSSKFNVSVEDFDDEIFEDDTAEVEIKISAFSVSSDYTDDAYIKVKGEFEGGLDCSFTAVGTEYFDVTVEEEVNNEDCSDIEVVVSNVTMDEEDVVFEDFEVLNRSNTKFYIDDIDTSENSSFLEVDVDDFDSYVNADDSSDFTLAIDSEAVSFDRTATVNVRVEGHFSAGGSCSFSQTENDSFSVKIEDIESGFIGGSDCEDIELNVDNVSVEQGETVEENFLIENKAGRRFYVDSANVYDNSGEIKSESNGFDKIIPSNGIGLVGVKVRAYDNAEVGQERAYIGIRGHFSNGVTCTLQDNERRFYVDIEKASGGSGSDIEFEEFKPFCNGFIFSAPGSVSVDNAGIVNLRIENNTGMRANIRFYGTGLTTDPHLLSVPAGFKSNSYPIRVWTEGGTKTLYYDLDTGNCLTRRSTTVYSTAAEQEEEQKGGEEQNNQQAEQVDVFGSIASGFAVLGANSFLLGLLVLAVLVVVFGFVFAMRYRIEPWQRH